MPLEYTSGLKKKKLIAFVLWSLAPLTMCVGLINFYTGDTISAIACIGSSVSSVFVYQMARLKNWWEFAVHSTAFLGLVIFIATAYEKMDHTSFMIWLPLYTVFYFMVTGLFHGILWIAITYLYFISMYFFKYSNVILPIDFILASFAFVSTAPLIYYYEKNNQKQIRTLNNLAAHDPKTSLLNKRYFLHILKFEIANNIAHQAPLHLMLMDIDQFEEINHKLGREVSDQLIKTLAKTLSENLREGDFIACFGEENFVILCPNTDHLGAHQLAGKINKMARNIHNQQQLTMSIGVAELGVNDSVKSLFRKADSALFQAKKKGKDCFVYFEQMESQYVKTQN